MSSLPSTDMQGASEKPEGDALRRVIGVAVAITLSIALLPILVMLGIVIRFNMGSPILFRQRRAGLGGTPFRIIKFRTMIDARDGEAKLLLDADRITQLGWFLRRFRIDELPQLLNIIQGELSLIGPRPLLPETIAAFGEVGRRRCDVRPGLTGWAQVNGNACLSDNDKLALDLWYIDNRSLALDLRIVLATFAVTLRGERPNLANIEAARSHARRRYRIG
jgi:lipopolysaccharide/colanic/teichoic acid biosynthesis glycosyltransferase